jgi:uncharacterized membrane protein YqjE
MDTELRDRSTGELVSELSDQATRLVRSEIELAKAELAVKGRKAGLGAGLFGGAGLFAIFGFAALTTAAIAALSTTLPVWASALIVAGVYLLIAAVSAKLGLGKVQEATPPAPERAIESTKQDVELTKARVKEARS